LPQRATFTFLKDAGLFATIGCVYISSFPAEGGTVVLDFDGIAGDINEVQPGDFFIMDTPAAPILGIKSKYGGEFGAVLLNTPYGTDEPFPCVVTADVLARGELIKLPKAFIAPALSLSALTFKSDVQDGPGSLTVSRDGVFLRITRRRSGFFYLDVGSGEIVSHAPVGTMVPRWAVKLPRYGSTIETVFQFDGPKPLS
jgi:hypothetical protein